MSKEHVNSLSGYKGCQNSLDIVWYILFVFDDLWNHFLMKGWNNCVFHELTPSQVPAGSGHGTSGHFTVCFSCHRHCFKNCASRSCSSWNPLIHRVYVQRIDICKLDGHVLSCNLHLRTSTRNICGLRPWKLLRSRSCPHFKLQRHFGWLLRTETDCQVDFSTQKGWDGIKDMKTKNSQN